MTSSGMLFVHVRACWAPLRRRTSGGLLLTKYHMNTLVGRVRRGPPIAELVIQAALRLPACLEATPGTLRQLRMENCLSRAPDCMCQLTGGRSGLLAFVC